MRLRKPLPLVAAQSRHSLFAVTYRAATKGSGKGVAMSARATTAAVALIALFGCGASSEARLRKVLASTTTGTIHLPPGTIEISSELALAPGAHDLEIAGADGTLLHATDGFRGRAILVIEGAKNIQLHDFDMDGNRGRLARTLETALPENYFRLWYPDNGILADRVEGLEITGVRLAHVTNFPILVSRASNIHIARVAVRDSGSRAARGRNNLSGGILIEEGSSQFEVRDSVFERISGNALWTHSLRISPRLEDGVFARNRFDTIGRDAIQVGAATRVRVEDNTGANIGYPLELVDVEHSWDAGGYRYLGECGRQRIRAQPVRGSQRKMLRPGRLS